jgi:hypothetical protein
MPLSFLSAAALPMAIEGVSQAGQLATKLAPTKLDKRNKARLAALQRRADRDLLGLTDAEEQVLRSQMQQERAAEEKALTAERARAIAASGQGSGAELAMALEAEQQSMEGAQRMGESIAAADLQKAAEEQDELEQLYAAEAQRQVQRRQAAADALSNIGDVAQAELLFARETAQGAQGQDAQTGAAANRTAAKESAEESREALQKAYLIEEYALTEEEYERMRKLFEENEDLVSLALPPQT